jgi:hypothetical protein
MFCQHGHEIWMVFGKKGMVCHSFHQFQSHCADIQEHGGIKPKGWNCDMLNLGPFAAIRSVQLRIRRDAETTTVSDNTPSGNTRGRTAYVEASNAMLQYEDMREAQGSSKDGDYERSNPKAGTKRPEETSGETGGFTAHIQEFSGESAAVP